MGIDRLSPEPMLLTTCYATTIMKFLKECITRNPRSNYVEDIKNTSPGKMKKAPTPSISHSKENLPAENTDEL